MVNSPIYSFVDFENRLPNIDLPSYQAQLAFQFYFAAALHLSREGGPIVISVSDINNNILFALNATITDACAWGEITNLNANADFPITVGAGEIIPAGIYDTVYDLWDALQAVGINANSNVFIQCCTDNLQDYTIAYTTAASESKILNINFYRGVVYVDNTSNDQEADFESNGIKVGGCYKLAVAFGDDTQFSNIFKRVDDTKYLAFLSYYNNEDSFEFYYGDGTLVNKLWLPFYLKKPGFVITRKIYRRSDKTYKVQFSTIEKEFEGTTDYFEKEIHDRLVVALEHDNKHVLSTGRHEFDADVFMNSDYSIAWQSNDIYDAPIEAQATFKVLEFFAGRNSNCEKRPPCIALPVQGDTPDCTNVTIDEITLPGATVDVPYSVDIMFSGTAPFVVSGVSSTGDGWTFTDIPNGVRVQGTPTNEDVAAGIDIIFHVSNCAGNGGEDYSGHIDIAAVPDGNTNVTNNTEDLDIEDVILNGPGVQTPYTGFPVTPGNSGTASIDYEQTDEIGVRFGSIPGHSVTLQLSINGSVVETKTETPISLVMITDNTYTIHAGDTVDIVIS